MTKLLLPLLCLLVGCRHISPVTLPSEMVAAPTVPVPGPAASVPTPTRPVTTASEPRSRQQAQIIEALLSQNDALTAQLAAMQTAAESKPVTSVVGPAQAAGAPTDLPKPTVAPEALDAITPNADGVIDLTGTEHAGSAGEPVNPFAVRTLPADQTREIGLKVGGIVLGSVPSALVNNRLVQAGDRIDSFLIERIEPDAVLVRVGPHLLRLPVSAVPARVRVAL